MWSLHGSHWHLLNQLWNWSVFPFVLWMVCSRLGYIKGFFFTWSFVLPFFFLLDDWKTKRLSYVYHLGEVMNIQASFLMAGHSPLRLVMENCVVTLEPNAASVPRYMFVQNQGSVSYGTFPELWKQDNYITSKFANILCPETILLYKILNEQFIY